jgi:hypothetical protein
MPPCRNAGKKSGRSGKPVNFVSWIKGAIVIGRFEILPVYCK